MTTKKSDRKKSVSKNLRGVLSPGERVSAAAGSAARAKANGAKAPKVKKIARDKYRSFSVTKAENDSLPGRAKKAGFDDVAAFCRFATLGVRD